MFWRKKPPHIVWHVPQGTEDFLVPRRATVGALGYDIVCPSKTVVAPRSSVIVNTLLAVTLPEGYGLIIKERSSLAFKHNIICGAGVIDEDFCGVLKIVLFNLSDVSYTIEAGERFVQARLVKNFDVSTSTEYTYPDPSRTKRGAGGLGSTGRK